MCFPKENTGNPTKRPPKGQNKCPAVHSRLTDDQKASVHLLHLSSCSNFLPCALESCHLGHWTFVSFRSPHWDKSALGICPPPASSAQAASVSQTRGWEWECALTSLQLPDFHSAIFILTSLKSLPTMPSCGDVYRMFWLIPELKPQLSKTVTLFGNKLYGGLNKNDPHRLMYLNA